MSVTLKQATHDFLLAKKAAGCSRRTLEKYRYTLRALGRHTDVKDLEDVTASDIRLYLADCRDAGQKATSLDTYYRTFSAFFNWCVAEYDTANPMERVEPIRVPKRLPPSLSNEAIRKLFEATQHSRNALRDRAILAVLLDTGIRAGELVGLKHGHVDFQAGELRVFGKDMEERVVPIGQQASKVLSRYLADFSTPDADRPLFISQRTKKALKVSGLRQVLKRLARRGDVKERVCPNLFRHAFARSWMRDGGDLDSLSELFGHSRVSTTRIYARQHIDEIKRKHQQISPANRLLRVNQLSLW